MAFHHYEDERQVKQRHHVQQLVTEGRDGMMGHDADLVDLGHEVGCLLCRMPNLTQRESNDCTRHSITSLCEQRPPVLSSAGQAP